jgi:hypothetical protein
MDVPGFPAGICERLAVYAVLVSQLIQVLGAIGLRRQAGATRREASPACAHLP